MPRPAPRAAVVGRGPSWLHARLKPLRRRTHVIRHGFDRLLYKDRDLFAGRGVNERIDAHYAEENRILAARSRGRSARTGRGALADAPRERSAVDGAG